MYNFSPELQYKSTKVIEKLFIKSYIYFLLYFFIALTLLIILYVFGYYSLINRALMFCNLFWQFYFWTNLWVCWITYRLNNIFVFFCNYIWSLKRDKKNEIEKKLWKIRSKNGKLLTVKKSERLFAVKFLSSTPDIWLILNHC